MMMQRIVLLSLLLSSSHAFVAPSGRLEATNRQPATALTASKQQNMIASSVLAASLALGAINPLPAQAYVSSDYASETVTAALQTLKQASGNIDETFKAYESIAAIITEGKGVGGMINYQGIALERGYIADEDTTIYNPGLTLLTGSEKERLVEAIVDSRKVGVSQNQWNDKNALAYDFLRGSLDPLHTYELSGFLSFVPIYGAILYLAAFVVQQVARDLFPTAYLIGVAAFALPIIALVAAGPQ